MPQNPPHLADTDYRAMPIADLMRHIGKQLRAHIKQHDTLSAFAKRSGVPPRTLTRLVSGEDVGIETLYRVLRTLERWDILSACLRPPSRTPLAMLEKQSGKHAKPPKMDSRQGSRPFKAHLAKPNKLPHHD